MAGWMMLKSPIPSGPASGSFACRGVVAAASRLSFSNAISSEQAVVAALAEMYVTAPACPTSPWARCAGSAATAFPSMALRWIAAGL
jgi:hypothetical protein